MTVLVLAAAPARHARIGEHPGRPMPRFDERGPSPAERIVDFALCLTLAIAVIALLLVAL